MTKEKIFLLVIVLLAVVVVILLLYELARKIRNSTLGWFLRYFKEGMQQQEEELATTPKSIAGMTRIYEPQIHRDFPEFNWVQFRNKAEDALRLSLLAISIGSVEKMERMAKEADISEALQAQLKGEILENEATGVKEVYDQIQIHQTEITRYEKKGGKCIITLQSAVGHIHYKEKAGKLLDGKKDVMIQTKYNTELMYIQDEDLADSGHGVGLNCPNCGAPVKSLGAKYCEYCGSGIVEMNMQVWSLEHFYEVTYQRV